MLTMPFTIHPVAPVFTPVAPLARPSGVQGEDTQVVVVNVQPETGSWPADVAFDTQRRLEWTRRILETEQVYSVRGARLNRGAWRCSARSRSTGRGNLKTTEGAEAHGAHPKRARVKHDPWTGHLRPAIGEVQVAAHTSLSDAPGRAHDAAR